MERELRRINAELETRVMSRTAELMAANEHMTRQINERERAEAELQRRNRELISLQSACAATASTLDLDFLLDNVTWEMTSLLGVESCTIYECTDSDAGVARIAEYGTPDRPEQTGPDANDLAACPVKDAVLRERCSRLLIVGERDVDPIDASYMSNLGIRTLLLVPMVFQDRVLGLVELRESRAGHGLSDASVAVAQLLANQVASAIENARLYERSRQEVVQRSEAERRLRDSLREKQVLLKEIHHRVKNNLQVICSLLSLQSRKIEDQELLQMFEESQNRVRSMALIHERLYRSDDLSSVDFGEYVRNLATQLVQSYRRGLGPVDLRVDAADVELAINAAVPCGLIVNELVTNSLKHAFVDGRPGEIHIELRPERDHLVTLAVGDNGVGFPDEVDFRQTDSLGMQLVNTLANQLGGTVELSNGQGTRFEIRFATA
jgi:two-component sensor histidine kinase